MKRRFISTLMALVMVLSLLPAQALAEDNTVTELNKNNISTYVNNGLGNGTYKLSDDVEITNTLTITGNTTLDLNDHVLQMKNASGSVFKIENGGHLTLEDNAANKTPKYFDRNDTTGLWTWRTDNSTSNYSVSGGVITGGSAHQGGGVYIGGGTFAMTGGSIVGCAATHTSLDAWGGGVFVLGGQFNMTGGNIVGCTAVTQGGYVPHGGGVCISMGTFNMSGGSITDCTAAAQGADGGAWGGGICNYSHGITTLSGTAKIQNCHATGNKCYGGGICDSGKLNISGNVQIIGCTAGGQGSDAMYINANNGSSVTGGTFYGSINSTKKISGHIVTYQVNGADYATQVVPSGETATQPADPTVPVGQTFDGWYKADGTEWNFTTALTDDLTLTGWLYVGVDTDQTFTDAMKNTGVSTIRLKNDITLPRLNWSMIIRDNRQLTLDLNGHVLDLGENSIHVGSNSAGALTIMDSNPTAEHKFTPNDDGLWVRDETNGDKIVKGGIITSSDSAIRVGGSGGKAIMNGGNIVGCGAGDGGAVSIVAGGQFTMNAGSIAGCKASGKGGGVYLLIGTFELAGGVIKSCKAGDKGGAVYVGNKDGIFTMTGGSIEGCKAANGSALFLYGKMEANGGTVDGTVVLDTKDNHGIHQGIIQGSGTNATQFNGTVTNKGTISYGTFNGTVENTGTLTGGTFNGLIRNGNPNAEFGNVNSPLGIIENKPGTGSSTYHTVTFAPAGSKMDYPVRYFLENGTISDQIKPASRTGYTFDGWYNGETKWDHTTDTVTEDMTLTAHWTGNTYTVTLDPNGGTVNPATITATYGADLPTMPVPVYPGYAFMGWYDAQTGGRCYGNENGASASSYDKTENCTLYAQWSVCDHSGSRAKPTCTTPAACTVCGGTIEKLPHDFTAKTVDAKYLKSAATCTEKAVYYKSCTVCGLSSKGTADEATFFSGNALDHDWGAWTSNGNDTHTRVCSRDASHTETDNCSGGTATCTAKAVCTVCGGEYGEMAAHNFTAEIAEADYLKSAATCTAKAVYYKSCTVCGLSSEGTADEATFFSGNVLGHNWGDWTPSSNKTHTRTCKTDNTHTETNNCADTNKDHLCDTCGETLTQHSGGTASCAAPATCGYCGKPYGEKNPANHSDLKHVPAKAATTQAEGNSEYWLCSGCGKCYKDAAAAAEIALSDTVIAKRIPRRYSGPTITVMGAAYYDGGNVGLTFVSSADFDTFTGVQVDGKTLAAKNYIAERGSIEVYLKAVYLRTLKNGSHTVTIQSTAGDVSAVFTVENSKTSPGTSDPGVAVYALSSMLSLTGLAALRRRKED